MTAKTCFICKGELPKRRTRFCSGTCSDYHDSIKRKSKTLRLSSLLTPRKCINCGDMYPPKTSRQKCCSTVCWDILAAERAKKRRIENRAKNAGEVVRGAGNRARKIGQYGQATAVNISTKLVDTTTFTKADTVERIVLQSKVEEYLANGGKIMKYGDQPAITVSESITKWEISSEEQDLAIEKYKEMNAHNGN